MKTIDQKLSPPQHTSFVAETVDTSWFQTGQHQHIEYELILFTEGTGTAYIGGYEGKFEPGDIFFIGSNLPHAFKNGSNKKVSAVGIRFRDTCFGLHFFNIPECRNLKQLLQISNHGLLLKGNNQYELQHMINMLGTATGVIRINLLLHCLHLISMGKEYITLTTNNIKRSNFKESESIDKVIEFTMASFQDNPSLSQAAAVACMSIPTFCFYFKLRTGKSYIDYLNEIRINFACEQLLKTSKCVTEICFESGYNTIVHFHRQFFKLKKLTPLQYRKRFSSEITSVRQLFEVNIAN